MMIAITGASGLVGAALSERLRARGDHVVAIGRDPSAALSWTVEDGVKPPEGLSSFDAVVHLAGAPIADGRWTQQRKEAIRNTRVQGTRAMISALSNADPRPRVFVSASAVGFYGDRADAVLTEDDEPGHGFLASVVEQWEDEAQAAKSLDVRSVQTRFGLILSPTGGALAKMLTPFRMGVGGRLGPGTQWMSWVHLDDVTRAICFALDNDVSGALNVTGPAPVQNREFTQTLGKVLHRPTIFPVPALALKILFGEMSTALLESQRAVPRRLQDAGFEFEHTDLRGALTNLLAS